MSAEEADAPVTSEEVREALSRIAGSRCLGGSERLCQLLTYSAEAALDGRSNELSQYRIGRDVFGKPESFDPAIDPLVRVEAGRLRRKLNAYYQTEGADDPVQLWFASRGYTTRIERRQPTQEEAAPPDTRLAVLVLPFLDLSPLRDQSSFCEGMTAELISQLATVKTVRVLSSSMSSQFHGAAVDVLEAGRKVGAQAVLEGSVRRFPAHSRIIAQLSDASNGFLLWSGSYNSQSDKPLDTQTKVVDSIRTALVTALVAGTNGKPRSGA